MNIDLSLSPPPGQAGPERGRGGAEQARAADAFAGLFASLVPATPPGGPDSPVNPPAASQSAPAAESPRPELPIWPGLVQSLLPETATATQAGADAPEVSPPVESPRPSAGGQAPLTSVAQDVSAAMHEPQPRIVSPARAHSPDDVRSLVSLPSQMPAAAPPSSGMPAHAAATDAMHGRNAAQVAQPAASDDMDGRSVAQDARGVVEARRQGNDRAPPLVPAVADSDAAAASRSAPAIPPMARSGVPLEPVPRAEIHKLAGADGAPAGPPISLQLPDTAAARAVQATAELGPSASIQRGAESAPVPTVDVRSVVAAPAADPAVLGLAPAVPVPARAPDGLMALPLASPTQPVPASELTQHAVAIIRELGAGRSHARIELHPAELGHLDLELRQDGQKLEINVAVDNEQSRRLVQDQFAQWRERLAESGIALQGLNVALREREAEPRQDSGGGNEHATPSAESDVNNPTIRRYSDPSRSLDIYA